MSVLALPVSSRDHIQGCETAIVTLVAYGNYQCPDCVHAHSMIQEIQQQFGEFLRYVFRHFPNSEVAHQAAEAAAQQGKFWQMHDRLFANCQSLEAGDLAQYAADLELDVMRFLRDLSEDVYVQKVQADVESGVLSGVCRTPTFFIDRLRYDDVCVKDRLIAALTQTWRS